MYFDNLIRYKLNLHRKQYLYLKKQRAKKILIFSKIYNKTVSFIFKMIP